MFNISGKIFFIYKNSDTIKNKIVIIRKDKELDQYKFQHIWHHTLFNLR